MKPSSLSPVVTRTNGRGGEVAVRLGWKIALFLVTLRALRALAGQLVRFRVELALGVVVLVLVDLLGTRWGLAAALAALGGALTWPLTREALWEALAGARCRRRLRAGVLALGLVGHRGEAGRVWWAHRVPVGTRMTYQVPGGQSGEQLQAKAAELRAAIRCREVRVRVLDRAHLVQVTAVRRESLAGRRVVSPLPAAAAAVLDGGPGLSMWEPITLGLSEDLLPISRRLIERNLLLGGEPGSGKSVAWQSVIGHAALSEDADLILFDAKTVEAEPWRGAARIVGADLAEANAVLTGLQAAMDRTYALLAELGLDKVAPGSRVTVLGVDELALYTSVYGTKQQREEFCTRLRDVVARGRAAGIVTVLATQRPSSDVVPTSLRDLIGWRWALRCTTDAASDTVLGDGRSQAGWSAKDVPSADRFKGIGWLLSEEGEPTRLRAPWFTRAELAVIADAARVLSARRSSTEAATLPVPHL